MSEPAPRSPQWKWFVCGLLLLATMLLYMDRQTLAQTKTSIAADVGINSEQYGRLEKGFGIAFAFGALFFGIVVDRVQVRWLYPLVLVGWSLAGVATAYAENIGELVLSWLTPLLSSPESWLAEFTRLSKEQSEWGADQQARLQRNFLGFFSCRTLLGVFEAGHWPCALVTTQRLLDRRELPLGNSILQSGASIGAVLTPLVVLCWNMEVAGNWRYPFVVIGLIGLGWIIPWFVLIRRSDLQQHLTPAESISLDKSPPKADQPIWRKFLTCFIVVVMINLTWQFFRAWLPSYLEERHGYTKTTVGLFTSAYYISSDVGCIMVGFMVRRLVARHWDVHHARVFTFGVCAAMTSLAFVIAVAPTGPWLLIMLLFLAAGSLGFFPNYYAFSQDLSRKHQGKITGTLGFCTWIASGYMQEYVGKYVEETKSYRLAIILAGTAPLIALAALLILWRPSRNRTWASGLDSATNPPPNLPGDALRDKDDAIRK
jgi:ACS family hexuronate transporter-like MFS transporter